MTQMVTQIEYERLERLLPRIPETTIFANFDGIDVAASGIYASGWAFDQFSTDEPCEVIVYQDARTVGRGYASLDRPDVQACGADRPNVGFRIRIRPTSASRNFRIDIVHRSKVHTLKELYYTEKLPVSRITEEDVVATFRILFGRDPENAETVTHQLSVHETKQSLFQTLFRSPEFYQNNVDVIAMLKRRKAPGP